MKNLVLFFFILLLPFQSIGQAIVLDTTQSLKKIDSTLFVLADTMFTKGYTDYSEPSSEDIFIDNLMLALKCSKTFKYKFPILTAPNDYHINCIDVIYSDDSLLRVFNWLSPQTGTWHNFPAIFQGRTRSGKIIVFNTQDHKSEGFIACTKFDLLARLPVLNKQVYLSKGYGQGSSRLPFEIYEGFEITDTSIIDSNELFMQNDTLTDGFIIDRESVMYDSAFAQDVPYSTFDSKTLIITYPKITNDNNPHWTGELEKMKFNGEYFIPTK